MVSKFTLAAVGVALLALPVAAQSPMERFFPAPDSCYLREYSADHLAKHPQQRTEGMSLTPMARRNGFQEVLMTVTVRDLPGEVLVSYAFCENTEDQLFCRMEGDAGAFSIAAADGGSIMVEVSKLGMNFEASVDFVTFERDRGDDRSFLLHPTRDCR